LSTPPAFVLSQDQTLRQKNRKTNPPTPTTQGRRAIQAEKDHPHPTEAGHRQSINQTKHLVSTNMAHY
ncbi:hypothetical protein ACFP5Z_08255, partial [Kocuria oceani]